MSGDKPLLGILLMLGFCVLAPLGDSMAKVLGETIPLGQLLLVRFGVQAVLLLPLVVLTARSLMMRRWIFWLMVLRTVLHIMGIGAMFTSLRYLPLADAIAIVFVMPFIMLLLGNYFLGEEVGRRRLVACCIGFFGTLLVIQPSFAALGPIALLPLMVAVNFSFFMLLTRQIARDVDAISLQAISGVVASVILGGLYFVPGLSEMSALSIVQPDGFEWGLLAVIGIVGTAAHLLMTWSLRFAPSATVAPMQYLEIPFATVIGYLVFGDWPNGLAMLGIIITMSAGVYIIMREQAMARAAAPVL